GGKKRREEREEGGKGEEEKGKGKRESRGEDSEGGALDQNLQAACLAALSSSCGKARELAMQYSWEAATLQFINNIRAA
ncbi:hypothetical protein ACC808_37510, partial [Rhizobium ruizarguesonis]